jgi:alpha-1,6-rhamnosyltransferase
MTSMTRPKISAVLPVHNLAAYVGEAIESVFAQATDLPVEIVVVDDGSTDDLDAALAPYEGRIRLVRQRNAGVAAASNAGVRAARGEYIAICDADDVQRPWRFGAQAAILDQDHELAQVFSDLSTWVDGEITVVSTLRDRPMGPFEKSFDDALDEAFGGRWTTVGDLGVPVPEEFRDRRIYRGRVPHLIAVRHVAWTAVSMLRREAVLAVGGFDPRMRRWQDWYLSSRLSQAYPVAYLDVPVSLYRQHATQLTKRPKLGAQMQKHVTDHVWRTDHTFRARHPELFRELLHHAAIRLGAAHVRDGEWGEARSHLREAAGARPGRREAWTALARATVMHATRRMRGR